MIHFIALNPPGRSGPRKVAVRRRHKNSCGCVICGHKRVKRARRKNWPKGAKLTPSQKKKALKNLGKNTRRSIALKNLAKARAAKKRYAKSKPGRASGRPKKSSKRSKSMATKKRARRRNGRGRRKNASAKQIAAARRNIKKAQAARRRKAKGHSGKKRSKRRGKVTRALKRSGLSKSQRKQVRRAILRKPKVRGSKTVLSLSPVQIKALRLKAARHQAEQGVKAFSGWAANPRRRKNKMARKRRKNGKRARARRRNGKYIRRRRLPKSVRRSLRRGQKGIRVKNRRRNGKRRHARRHNPGTVSIRSAKDQTFLFFRMKTWKDTIIPGVAGFSAALTLPIAVAKALKKPQLNQGPVGVLASAGSAALVSLVAGYFGQEAKKSAFTGGAIATGIKLIAWIAPKVAAKLIPMSGSSVSVAPVSVPAAAPRPAGMDGGVLYGDDLISGEAAAQGIGGFLQMNGMDGFGDFVDPSALAQISNEVGFDAGRERF